MTRRTHDNPLSPHGPARSASAPRFYCPGLASAAATPGLSDQIVDLERDENHHARRVLRLGDGDEVELFDGCGTVGRGVLAHGAGVRLASIQRSEPSRRRIDVAVAIPKGRHADDLVPMLSQLGVHGLIPLRTQRGVAQPGGGKLDRFRKAAIESAKQCRRPYLMGIDEPRSLEEVFEQAHGQRLIADPAGEALTPDRIQDGGVLILVGPEGGWTEPELALAARAGCTPWRLGGHILRIETAAIAAAALAGYWNG